MPDKNLFPRELVDKYQKAADAAVATVEKSTHILLRSQDMPVQSRSKNDMWAVGVSLYELLFGERPFDRSGDRDLDLYVDLKAGARARMLNIKSLGGIKECFRGVITDLLNPDHELRPSAAPMLRSPIVNLTDDEFKKGRELIQKFSRAPNPQSEDADSTSVL